MRKYKRSMARANMKKAGISHINKSHINKKGYYKADSENEKPKSFFARNWRKWILGKPGKRAA